MNNLYKAGYERCITDILKELKEHPDTLITREVLEERLKNLHLVKEAELDDWLDIDQSAFDGLPLETQISLSRGESHIGIV